MRDGGGPTPWRARIARRAGMAALGAALAGCTTPTSPAMRAALTVSTERTVYALADDPPMVTLRHGGGPAVTISGCPDAPAAILERRTGDAWAHESSRGLLCPAVLGIETVRLSAGEARAFPLAPGRAGVFRVRVLIGPRGDAPERAVLSPEFEVR